MRKGSLLSPEQVSEQLGGTPSARTLKDWASKGKVSYTGGVVNGMRMPIRFTQEQFEELLQMFNKPAREINEVSRSQEVTHLDAKRKISQLYIA
ncbi:hypothetical protein ACIP5Z_02270 [Rothia terrae]|uniref:hypothetical protein n=1 Tax=Rothia terrae TaxID=396015 RepID=UPI0038256A8A